MRSCSRRSSRSSRGSSPPRERWSRSGSQRKASGAGTTTRRSCSLARMMPAAPRLRLPRRLRARAISAARGEASAGMPRRREASSPARGLLGEGPVAAGPPPLGHRSRRCQRSGGRASLCNAKIRAGRGSAGWARRGDPAPAGGTPRPRARATAISAATAGNGNTECGGKPDTNQGLSERRCLCVHTLREERSESCWLSADRSTRTSTVGNNNTVQYSRTNISGRGGEIRRAG